MKLILTKIAASLLIPFLAASCQIKGMRVADTGEPVPYNISIMKKSSRDTQNVIVASGKNNQGYTYNSETINGDETIVPVTGIHGIEMVSAANAAASVSKVVSNNKASTTNTASNNATTVSTTASNNALKSTENTNATGVEKEVIGTNAKLKVPTTVNPVSITPP